MTDGDVGGDAALAGARVLRRLQDLLREAGFDAFVEGACKPYYAPLMARRRFRRDGISSCT